MPVSASDSRRLLRAIATFAGVILLFTAATVMVFRHWMPLLHSALIGPPEDNMQDLWNTWYAAVARTPGRFFFTDLIRFPEGTPLRYHSFAYPHLFLVALVSKAVGTDLSSLVLLHNLSLLMSFPLAGAGAFYLVRHFTGHTGGAILGGFVFAFNPSHVEHVMHHAHVSSIEFVPVFVLFYLLAIERRSRGFLILAVAAFALGALSCWYHLFYCTYFIAFHGVYAAVRDGTWPRGWQLSAPLACLAGGAVLLSPLLVPMVAAAMSGAPVYDVGGNVYVADAAAYAAFPEFHLLAPLTAGIYDRLSANRWEGTVYLGLVNMAVLAWLIAVRRKNDRLLSYALAGMAVFGILACGDRLQILGHRTIPLPDLVLSQLPFFRNVRAPSRAIVFVYLFLAIGIGYAVSLLWRERARAAARWGVAILATLIVVDFLPARPLAMAPVACPASLAEIRDDPEQGFGVLDLPSSKSSFYVEGNFYMLQQICHGRPIAQGNTSRDMVVSLRDRLESASLEAQRRQLVAAKIKYIVIHRRGLGVAFDWHPEDGPYDQYARTYTVVHDDADLTILRVY
jgi:hypothetical protein